MQLLLVLVLGTGLGFWLARSQTGERLLESAKEFSTRLRGQPDSGGAEVINEEQEKPDEDPTA